MSFFFFLKQMTSSASTVLPAKQVAIWGLEKEKGGNDYTLLPIAALGKRIKGSTKMQRKMSLVKEFHPKRSN